LSDGIGGMDFLSGSAIRTINGKYFFGGEHGLIEFSPDKSAGIPPNLVLSDLKISNSSVLTMAENSPLKTSLYDLKKISLPHSQNDLTFEYTVLHYCDPRKNKYAHKLEGYEENWLYDDRRIATYTNLDPGEYTFKFKGANRDGIWTKKINSISILIMSPWWQTWWAYSGYFFCFVGLLAGIRRYELNRRQEKEDKRILKLENERKTNELEEARSLQLSMLPKEVPGIFHLDIAVYMKTATEVGGDYYDFHVAKDGTLTAVIADATGHGMQAGMMVTATKSLFQNLGGLSDLEEIFHQFNTCLYQMQLQPLFMSMTLVRINDKKLEVINGGMPGLLIYRNNNDLIEEITSSGPPLGAYPEYLYKKTSTEICSNDVILSMSDGFAERLNENDEIIGYDKCKEIFKETVSTPSKEIIKYFNKKSDDWAGTRDPEDDMTFLVLKYQ